ncbi:hypothetical protein [Listeria rustica]|uniref:Uncharacterized protein n=1 Tax=Listeria rustica TaxID=2713503 RepID=A0A7W1T505_9LIST|nr:hypothetical protein [Listeria rustica]MBA3925539.1 hypothetical protein [Listeria rustica]
MKKIVVVIVIMSLLATLFLYYAKYRQAETNIQDLHNAQKHVINQQEIEKKAIALNTSFLDAFLTYSKQSERYAHVKKLVTTNVLADAFPSQSNVNSSVASQIMSQVSYVKVAEGIVYFINDLKIKTTYDMQENEYRMILQTKVEADKVSELTIMNVTS